MASRDPRNQSSQLERLPHILRAIREGLIEQKSRIDGTKSAPNEADLAGAQDDWAGKEFDPAPLSSTLASSVALALPHSRLSIEAISNDAPSISPIEPSSDVEPEPRILHADKISSDRSPVRRPLFRIVLRGLIFAIAGAAVFVILPYGESRKQDIVEAWRSSLSWMLPNIRSGRSSATEVTPETSARPLEEERKLEAALPPTGPGIQPVIPSASTGVPDLWDRLDVIAKEVALVRDLADRLLVRQSQIEEDFAKLRSAEHETDQKVSSGALQIARVRSHRKAQKTH